MSNNTETYWVNGEPFDLVFTTNPAFPKPNTEKYWFNAQPVSGLLELAPGPYTPPYVPPTPVTSPYGSELFWFNGEPSDQFFPISDTTPPSFTGISSLTLGSIGQLLVAWPPASDISSPINYQIFIQANSSVGLFQQSNVAISTTQTTCSIFALPNGTLLQNDTYFVGVRAIDAAGNGETNSVFLSQSTTGVEIPVVQGGPYYEPRAVFSINASNQLQGTFWVIKQGELVNQLQLGSASYTVYDKDGNTIGITESGIISDINGYFEITPVNAASILDLTHYVVKIEIIADGETRIGTVGITLGE